MTKDISPEESNYFDLLNSLPDNGWGYFMKMMSSVHVTQTLEHIITHMDEDPYPILKNCFEEQTQFLNTFKLIIPQTADGNIPGKESQNFTAKLFENAWTTYSSDTYDHSVELIKTRLENSGFTRKHLADKKCFDGGCGTGRFSLALSQLGAESVISADIGGESLEFFRKTLLEKKITNIETVEQDITDLGRFADEKFDLVISQGVLHHTEAPMKGLKEHWRILKKGGSLWLYLYGDGGCYWPVYDRLREQLCKYESSSIKQTLCQFSLREGFVYTFLDNVLAPREYYLESEIEKLVRSWGDCEIQRTKGRASWDDTDQCLKTAYGKDILGPEGEVRILIKKI